MMLNIWQYAKGYVRIKVTGFGLERFMNMVAFRGIYIWDAMRTAQGVELNVTIAGFKMLKGCGKKTKCRIKIIQKIGLPFLLHRYRKRKLLMGGVGIFVLGVFILSSFVWRIDIAGNQTLPQETVLAFLEGQGLYIGAPKFRLNDRDLQQALLANFTEISWADVYTRGTRTTVRLAEALPPQAVINRHMPTHVVATAEGVITQVVAWGGAPMVEAGDVVQAGALLVSGVLELVPDTPDTPMVYVHAQAEVWARRYHPIEFIIPLAYSEKIFTGQMAVNRALQLLFWENIRINLPGGSHSFPSYDKITTHHQPGAGGNYPLPLVLVYTHFYETVAQPRTRTVAEAKDLAEGVLTARIIRELDFAIDIVERRVDFYETPDALQVRAMVITNERIDRQIPITVE